MTSEEKHAPEERDQEDAPDARRVIRSAEIFAGMEEVFIEHEGQTYRLRQTRTGKLILHK